MVNKVTLVGRLGKDPETRTTSGGKTVTSFSLATTESWKDGNGERQKRTEWHNIVLWGNTAEIAQKYLQKGSLAFIEGRIQTRDFESQGQKRRITEIIGSDLKLLDSPPGGREQVTPKDDDTIPF